MCGIAGAIAPPDRLDEEALRQLGTRMGAAIAHRGPDDAGTWTDAAAGLVLAHRRLAIVDLSPEGHQPMVSDDGRWVIAFNGEIISLFSSSRTCGSSPCRASTVTRSIARFSRSRRSSI